MILPLILVFSSMALGAGRWFYPGPGPERVELAADSTLNGATVGTTGALLVRFESHQALRSLQAQPGWASTRPLRGDGLTLRIQPKPGVDEFELSRRLHDSPGVLWSHPDLRIRLVPRELPDDPYVGDQWHLENDGSEGWTPGVDINAELAWSVATGAGGLVAVVDSSVDLDHPDLRVTPGWDYVDSDDDPSPGADETGGSHGTCAAGLAAASGDNGIGVAGVAYDADIYAIRLIGGDTSISDLHDAFVEAVDAGAWVISNSWGFGDDCSPFPTWGALGEALDYAESDGRGGLGAVVVAAAGNSNCDISGDGFLKHPVVVGVAASNGNDVRESYSCFGDNVDVTAPSGGVLTTDTSGSDGYGSHNSDSDYYPYFSGTSAATPVASGVAALMIAANPRIRADELRQVLCDTSVRIDLDQAGYNELGWSPYYGCGRVDAAAAVNAVANQPPSAPVTLGPEGQAWADRVILRWEPALDPDAERLRYEVQVQLDYGSDAIGGWAEEVDGTTLDITDHANADVRVLWQVRAVDAWGAGEWSAESAFDVVSIPEPPEVEKTRNKAEKGCSTLVSAPGLLLSLMALFGTLRRRRSS